VINDDAVPSAPSPAAPTKVCPSCSIQTQTDGGFCPHCGQPYQAAKKSRRRQALITSAIVLTLAGGGVGVAVAIDRNRDADAAAAAAAEQTQRQADEEVRKESEARASAEATEAAILAAKERQAAEVAELSALVELLDKREKEVNKLEKMVLKNAKKHVNEGSLDGPILKAVCMAVSGDAEDDPDAHATVYDCIAATTDNGGGSYSGYSYTGNINWYDGAMTAQMDS